METNGPLDFYALSHKLATRTLGFSSQIRNQNGLCGERTDVLPRSGNMISFPLSMICSTIVDVVQKTLSQKKTTTKSCLNISGVTFLMIVKIKKSIIIIL